MTTFWISLREIVDGAFTSNIGATSYLAVPDDQDVTPAFLAPTPKDWADQILAAAGVTGAPGKLKDIVFFVHGFDNTVKNVQTRHRLLQAGLTKRGYDCIVVSFDWPSDDKTLAYLEDRQTAKTTAMRLVVDGIRLFAVYSRPDCPINVHVLAHSMGAYLVREAFDDADDSTLKAAGWTIGQLVLVAGDISSASLVTSTPTSESLYLHCYRMHNYYSGYDEALQVSNVKRLGLAPRVGRVGLPEDSPDKAVDIDCSTYYSKNLKTLTANVPSDVFLSHSWYFYDAVVMKDLAAVLAGTLDRNVISTRVPSGGANSFSLAKSSG